MYFGPEVTPFTIGIEISNRLAEELMAGTVENAGPGELEVYVRKEIFEKEPHNAVGVYLGLVTSPDMHVRAIALEGLGELKAVDASEAKSLLAVLMTDHDEEIRRRAFEYIWPE